MANEIVEMSRRGSIEATGVKSVGRGVVDNGISGAVVMMLIEIGVLPETWQGPQTIIVLTAVGGVAVKFLRKLFSRYQIME